MSHFTQEQLKELATFFNLPMPKPDDVLPIRDGVVRKTDRVWWRYCEGSVQVLAANDWGHIEKYPQLYSHTKPQVKAVIYQD